MKCLVDHSEARFSKAIHDHHHRNDEEHDAYPFAISVSTEFNEEWGVGLKSPRVWKKNLSLVSFLPRMGCGRSKKRRDSYGAKS